MFRAGRSDNVSQENKDSKKEQRPSRTERTRRTKRVERTRDRRERKRAEREKSRKKKLLFPAYSLVGQIRANKKAFYVYLVLSVIVIAVLIRSVFLAQWESVYICFLTLLLFLIPPFVEKSMRIELPSTLQIIAFIFIFCAEILGEISSFYVRVPIWDTLLHTVCGFIFAAFGFCIVDIFNRGRFNKFDMSPAFLAFVAFCFSMTVGIFWEFIEFGADHILMIDMQKDFVVRDIYTVTLDPTNSNQVVAVKDIVQTVIETADGSTVVIEGGYLDVGIADTMKDLLVNFIGAVVFSVIGFFYVKQRGEGAFARQFIPQMVGADEEKEPGAPDAAEAKTLLEAETPSEATAVEGAEFAARGEKNHGGQNHGRKNHKK